MEMKEVNSKYIAVGWDTNDQTAHKSFPFEKAEGAIGFVRSGFPGQPFFSYAMVINKVTKTILMSAVRIGDQLHENWTKYPLAQTNNVVLEMFKFHVQKTTPKALEAKMESKPEETPAPPLALVEAPAAEPVETKPTETLISVDDALKQDTEAVGMLMKKYLAIGRTMGEFSKYDYAKLVLDEVDALLAKVAHEQSIIEKVDEDERWQNLKAKFAGIPEMQPLLEQVNDIFKEVDIKHSELIKNMRTPQMKLIRETYAVPPQAPVPAPTPEPEVKPEAPAEPQPQPEPAP